MTIIATATMPPENHFHCENCGAEIGIGQNVKIGKVNKLVCLKCAKGSTKRTTRQNKAHESKDMRKDK